jgi:hypothetical protein
MNRSGPPVSLAGSQLGQVRHVCAFFNNDDELYRVLLPFIRDGFASGDKSVHVINPNRHEDHMGRLVSAGIDAEGARRTGQFDLKTNTDTYLVDGCFNQDRMLESFEQLVTGNERAGYPMSRIVCQMEWAGEGQPYIHDVVEFESRVNAVWERHPDDAVICTYNLEKFGGDAVVDIMRTHPLVIIGGTLQLNPFFMPSAEFLREYRQRRAREAGPLPT